MLFSDDESWTWCVCALVECELFEGMLVVLGPTLHLLKSRLTSHYGQSSNGCRFPPIINQEFGPLTLHTKAKD